MRLATAIVVARGGSVRLPNKALLHFAGTTLLGHKVRTLLRCERVGRVVVGSDSDAILAEAERHGATAVRRDAFHCDETRCSANEMIRDMVSRVPGGDDETFVWAHPTNPLVRAKTYDNLIAEFEKLSFVYDSLATIRQERRHAWFDGEPLNHEGKTNPHRPAADLRTISFQDGAAFIQTRRRFLETAYFYGDRPNLRAIDWQEGWDVDTYVDYRTAIALWDAYRPCESPSSPAVLPYDPCQPPLTLPSLSA